MNETPGPDADSAEGVPYGKLLKWGRFVVRGARVTFLVTLGLGLLSQTLQQYLVQLLAVTVAALKTTGESEPGPAGGFLGPVLPSDPKVTVLLLAGLVGVSVILVFTERVLTSWSDARMLAALQQTLHDRLLRLGPSYHRQHDVGETTVIVSRYAAGSQQLLRDYIAFPLTQGVALITALVFLVNGLAGIGETPFVLRLVLVAALFVLPAVSLRLARALRVAFTKVREADVAVADELVNSLAQPLEVQLMGAEEQRSRAFGSKLRTLVRHRVAAGARSELAAQVTGSMPTVLQAAFLVYGVFRAAETEDPRAAGAIVAIYGFVPLVISPIQQILQYFNGLSSTWPLVEKVVEILEREPEIKERAGAVALSPTSLDIRLDNVSFSYPDQARPVLDQIDCVFTGARTTALVGESGSGKSTIFNLIARLCDPQSGTVRLGGHDVRDVQLGELRRRVVRVAQFPLFIVDTIRENFRLMKADATDQQIMEVCQRVGLWNVLVRVAPEAPLDYVLPRELSQGLSGGQRRLLAIARAMLHQPQVLLLDEPSPGLDNITLQMLIRFLRESCAGVTVLIVDHDVEGFIARVADQICVLENGRILATGTHEQLASRPGLYRRLLEAREAEPPATKPITAQPESIP